MHVINLLVFYLAARSFASAIPASPELTNLTARADAWPVAKAREVDVSSPSYVEKVVLGKDEKFGKCINARTNPPIIAIMIDDGIMCEYWDSKDCVASAPNGPMAFHHLGPYGGAKVQKGLGMYTSNTFRAGTFPMWSPQSYKCSRITFGNTPIKHWIDGRSETTMKSGLESIL